MALNQLQCSIRGVSPLLLNNGQMADPMNKFAKAKKEISGKKKRTDEDHAELSRIDWHGALYVNADQRLIMPASLLEATVCNGAKRSKLGKVFKSAVFVLDDAILDIGREYDKASDLWFEEQFRDTRAVGLMGKRVMKTRPIFSSWGCDFAITYDDEQVNLNDVERALNDAGMTCGLGDFRPRYGRFKVV